PSVAVRAVLHPGVACPRLDLALAQRLPLAAPQDGPALEGREDVVVVAGPPVRGDRLGSLGRHVVETNLPCSCCGSPTPPTCGSSPTLSTTFPSRPAACWPAGRATTRSSASTAAATPPNRAASTSSILSIISRPTVTPRAGAWRSWACTTPTPTPTRIRRPPMWPSPP